MAQESQKPEVSRRDFLKTGAKAGAAGLTAFSGITFITKPERVFGANDRVNLAVCGVRGRGMDHIRSFGRLPNATLAALCDRSEERRVGKECRSRWQRDH